MNQRFIFLWVAAAAAVFSANLCAQTRTSIRDTLYNADGSRTAGQIEIAWNAFRSADGKTIAAGKITRRITDGVLDLALVPNAGTTPAGTSYAVTYLLASGLSYSETWAVPQSDTPVSLAAVRVSVAPSPAVLVAQQQISEGAGMGVLLDFYRAASATASRAGQCYWNTTANALYCSTGTGAWQNYAPGTPAAHAGTHASNGADPLAIDASQIASGTLTDARFPATITGDKTLNGSLTLGSGDMQFTGALPGDPWPLIGDLDALFPFGAFRVNGHAVLYASDNIWGGSPGLVIPPNTVIVDDGGIGTLILRHDVTEEAAGAEEWFFAAGQDGYGSNPSSVMAACSMDEQDCFTFFRFARYNTGDYEGYHVVLDPLRAGGTAVGGNFKVFGSAETKKLNRIPLAHLYPGNDAGARIIACIAALPATGGTCDARGFEGAQTISADLFAGVTKPGTLLLGAAKFTVTASSNVPRHWNIIGLMGFQAQSWQDADRQTVFQNDSANTPTFIVGGNAEISGCNFQGSGPGAHILVTRDGIAIRNNSIRGKANAIQFDDPGNTYNVTVEGNIFSEQTSDILPFTNWNARSPGWNISLNWFRKAGGFNGRGINIPSTGGITGSIFNNIFDTIREPLVGAAIELGASKGVRLGGNHYELVDGGGAPADVIHLGNCRGIELGTEHFDGIYNGVRIGSARDVISQPHMWDNTNPAGADFIMNSDASEIYLYGVPPGKTVGTGSRSWIYFDDGNLLSTGNNIRVGPSGNLGVGTPWAPTQRGQVWGGNIEAVDPAVLAGESLTDGAFALEPGAGNWTVTGGWDAAFTGSKGNYDGAGGAGNLAQSAANMAIAGARDHWYKFQYTVTVPLGVIGATITNTFASVATTLPLAAGAQTVYFKTKAAPGAFTIAATGAGSFTIDGLSLEEIVGGDGIFNGFINWSGQKRVATQFDKTNDAALGNIPGLSVVVQTGKTYSFEAILFTTSNVASGVQAGIGGTATATAIIYEGLTVNAGLTTQGRAAALGTAVGAVTAVTAAQMKINGTITVNAGGTLTAQFAQNVAGGAASSVLVGSTFTVENIP